MLFLLCNFALVYAWAEDTETVFRYHIDERLHERHNNAAKEKQEKKKLT